jgi:DNA topoisomerase-2
VISFKHSGREEENEAIVLAFSKSMADARKKWLQKYDPDQCIDHSKKTMGFKEFIDLELIHFSVADN